MTRWRTAVAVVSLLVLGAVIGVTTDRMLHRPQGRDALQLSDVEADPLGVMDRMLDLRPDQRERVAAILEARQDEIDRVWHDTHHRLLTAIDSVVNEIAAVLDPDQAERFRALADELHGTGRTLHGR